MNKAHSHYFRDVTRLTHVDVYRIHDLYQLGQVDNSGALHHASKKLLLAGQRGAGKSLYQDIKESRDTLNRKLAMLDEDIMALVPEATAEQVTELEQRLGQPLDALWAEADAARTNKMEWAKLVGVRHGPDGMPFDANFDDPIDPLQAVQALIKAAPNFDWGTEIEATVGIARVVPADPETERLAAAMQEAVDILRASTLPLPEGEYLPGVCVELMKQGLSRLDLPRKGLRTPVGADLRFDQTGRQEAVEQNGNTGEHYLPGGMSWAMAPTDAVALVRSAVKDDECLYVWVPAIDRDVKGVVAIAYRDQLQGSPQGCGLGSADHVWEIVGMRPKVCAEAEA